MMRELISRTNSRSCSISRMQSPRGAQAQPGPRRSRCARTLVRPAVGSSSSRTRVPSPAPWRVRGPVSRHGRDASPWCRAALTVQLPERPRIAAAGRCTSSAVRMRTFLPGTSDAQGFGNGQCVEHVRRLELAAEAEAHAGLGRQTANGIALDHYAAGAALLTVGQAADQGGFAGSVRGRPG